MDILINLEYFFQLSFVVTGELHLTFYMTMIYDRHLLYCNNNEIKESNDKKACYLSTIYFVTEKHKPFITYRVRYK